jgi:hypothetical protein
VALLYTRLEEKDDWRMFSLPHATSHTFSLPHATSHTFSLPPCNITHLHAATMQHHTCSHCLHATSHMLSLPPCYIHMFTLPPCNITHVITNITHVLAVRAHHQNVIHLFSIVTHYHTSFHCSHSTCFHLHMLSPQHTVMHASQCMFPLECMHHNACFHHKACFHHNACFNHNACITMHVSMLMHASQCMFPPQCMHHNACFRHNACITTRQFVFMLQHQNVCSRPPCIAAPMKCIINTSLCTHSIHSASSATRTSLTATCHMQPTSN